MGRNMLWNLRHYRHYEGNLPLFSEFPSLFHNYVGVFFEMTLAQMRILASLTHPGSFVLFLLSMSSNRGGAQI